MEIKGTKDGILVNLENQDWLEAKGDLVGQIDARLDFFNGAQLILDVGNNVLRAKELGELRDFLSEKGRHIVRNHQPVDRDQGNGSDAGDDDPAFKGC